MLSIWMGWGKLRSGQILPKCETTFGNLLISEGKTTEHNHLKPFTGQEKLSFI
jgi:hypothetical protein